MRREEVNTHVIVLATMFERSSAAFVTRRFTDLTTFSLSENALETSFLTGEDSERRL